MPTETIIRWEARGTVDLTIVCQIADSCLTGQVRWHRSLETVSSDSPAIYIAHEFFDALPVHQFQKTDRQEFLPSNVSNTSNYFSWPIPSCSHIPSA